jgi:hypothetical protein
MLTKQFRTDYYPQKLTDADLRYLTTVSSQALYGCHVDGRDPSLWQFVFDSVVDETRRRSNDSDQEPAPLVLPQWFGETLGHSIICAQTFAYLNLSPGCAEFADWLLWSLIIRATAILKELDPTK